MDKKDIKKSKENQVNKDKQEFVKVKKEEFENLKKQSKEDKDSYLRILAEFENFRKNTQEEKNQIRDRTIRNFILDILPSIENFEESLKAKENVELFTKGVEYIHQNLLKVLEDHKIISFEPKIGEEFNPKAHDPILSNRQEGEEGKVLGVIKKGFKHNDLIIVPAKVEVKKAQ